MRKIILASLLLLAGCKSVQSVWDAPVIKFEPEEATAVSIYVPHFYVLTPENALRILNEKKILIAISYDDSIELRKSLEDVNTHILIQNETIKVLKQ